MHPRQLRIFNLVILRHRLLIFLSTLLALLIVFPILHQFYPDYIGIMNLFFSMILIAGIYIVSSNRQTLTIAILLALLTFAVVWFNLILHSQNLLLFGLALEIVFFTITTTVIIQYVLSYHRVTADKIYGAICGYLLIGLIWALIYTMLENAFHGSFEFTHGLRVYFHPALGHRHYYIDFIYYSFVTLTTLGYGDITPLSSPARFLSSLEAIAGQLYVAVLISRLVGLHIGHTLVKYQPRMKQ